MSCREASSAERAKAPFGRDPSPLFTCDITLPPYPSQRYAVQVLENGCFVGERVQPGRADYGCIR